MSLRAIIFLPDERLRLVSKPVTDFDDSLDVLIEDMFETMYHARGVGLAAPQIGVSLQLAVIDVTRDKSEQLVIINPEIKHTVGAIKYEEGCLSVPGLQETVVRAEEVTVRAQNQKGEWFEITASGLLGECLQHEIDHLNGKLFIDLLPPLRKTLARKKYDKYRRKHSE